MNDGRVPAVAQPRHDPQGLLIQLETALHRLAEGFWDQPYRFFTEADAVAGLQRWVATRPETARALERAIADTIAEGKVRTYDLGGSNTTLWVAKVEALLALCDALAAEVAAAEEVRVRLLQAVLNGGQLVSDMWAWSSGPYSTGIYHMAQL